MDRTFSERFSQTFTFSQNGFEKWTFDERASGDIRIFLDEGCSEFKLELDAKEYSYVKIFVQVRSAKRNHLDVQAICKSDARIRLGFLDIDHGVENLKVHADLVEQGATFEIYTGQLCKSDLEKTGDIKITHLHPYTYGNIHNFAVCMERGMYDMVADGTIKKGAAGSESHQETRVLTLGDQHKTRVLPLLYIDENDVKASHALSIGQPDESQLYYIQSRGLKKEQAIGLLSIGYFMPVIDLVDDENEHEALRMELESKVGLHEY